MPDFLILAYIGKIVTNFDTVKAEYSNTVPSSLYAGFTMILMLLSSYIFPYAPYIGKPLWLFAIALHALHIIVFTFRNVIKNFNIDTFVPTWFVTYNGVMVSSFSIEITVLFDFCLITLRLIITEQARLEQSISNLK